MDLGVSNVVSKGGLRYYMICTDRTTSFRLVYFLKTKAEVQQRFQQLALDVFGLRGTIKAIRVDSGSEFIGRPTKDWCKARGITVTSGGPHGSQQNGKAERSNLIGMDMTRALLKMAGLGDEHWVLAMSHAVYLLNRLPTSSLDYDTPYHALHQGHCDLSHLRVFGCRAWFHVMNRKKLDAKAREGIMVGCDENNPRRYRIWDPAAETVRETIHVSFDETVFPARHSCFGREDYTLALDADLASRSLPEASGVEAPVGADTDASDDAGSAPQPPRDHIDRGGTTEDELVADDRGLDDRGLDGSDSEDETADGETDSTGAGFSRLRRHDTFCQDPTCPELRHHFYHKHGAFCPGANLSEHFAHAVGTAVIDHTAVGSAVPDRRAIDLEPRSYREAMRSPNAPKWRKACDEEMQSQLSNGTWKLIVRTDKMRVIKCIWVFKLKRNELGEIVRWKARLVIQGFRQEYGLDYFETFSPVAKMSSVRVVLAVSAALDLELVNVDIDVAFLNADVDEEIYMTQPEGYAKKSPDGKEYVCKLLKSLYGLKQSPRNWWQHIDKLLKSMGFIPSSADPCVYIKTFPDGSILIVVLYVDDLIIAGSSMKIINDFKAELAKHYKMKDLGELTWILGMHITRDRENRTLEIHQSAYIDQMLERFGMADCYTESVPALEPLPRRDATSGGKPDKTYMSLVGALLWSAMISRPDVAFAVQVLGRYLQASGPEHMSAAKRRLRYLKGTRDRGIKYGGKGNDLTLVGYSDSDHAGDKDTRKSTTGYVFVLNGGPVSWGSRLQDTVAASTSEAEYMAACAAAQEAIHLRQLLKDLGLEQKKATVIYEDNNAAIAWSENPLGARRAKHIDVKYHFVRERVAMGQIKLDYIASANQLADLFTKPLKEKFAGLRDKLLG